MTPPALHKAMTPSGPHNCPLASAHTQSEDGWPKEHPILGAIMRTKSCIQFSMVYVAIIYQNIPNSLYNSRQNKHTSILHYSNACLIYVQISPATSTILNHSYQNNTNRKSNKKNDINFDLLSSNAVIFAIKSDGAFFILAHTICTTIISITITETLLPRNDAKIANKCMMQCTTPVKQHEIDIQVTHICT